jgi:AraC family transcriptional regulator of adaptative response/methylated-DNA-[protein]-cysteine methyltransferase
MMNETFSQQSSDYQRIEKALQFLEANFLRQPSLEEIANSVHLSKYHFQRLFKRWAGVSPTQFLQFLTIDYAKQRLLESQNVLDATLSAGLSSPGRLHDLFVTFEAVTPGEYKKQGAGLKIAYGVHDTPFGQCLLATTSRGICDLRFVQEDDPSTMIQQLAMRWPQADLVEKREDTQPLVDRIFAPMPANQPRPFHLMLKGTNFQVNVWQALLTIPPGALVSYQDVASYLGNPQATRAVAGAIARNPVAYLIPCHRAISKLGKAHNYQWGIARKKAMLGWEASRQHRQG